MIRKIAAYLVLGLLIGLPVIAGASNLDDKIRAAGSDIKIFCPATDAKYIQWSALLYLNQTYGAEIHIALFQPSPGFACKIESTGDGQFHIAQIGLGTGTDQRTLVDSISACLFDSQYPDIAIFEAGSSEDSLWLAWLMKELQKLSITDSTSVASLENIYVRGEGKEKPAVLFNDNELFHRFIGQAEYVSKAFPNFSPLNYQPVQYCRYFLLNPLAPRKAASNDFLYGTDLGPFRLPQIIDDRMADGPEKKNVLRRLESFKSAISTAGQVWLSRSDKLRSLMTAYSDITWLENLIESGTGHIAETGTGKIVTAIRKRAFGAIEEAVGIDWHGNLEVRETPFGKTGKLSLDLFLGGPREIELSYFRFHPTDSDAIVVDSISKTVQPHQRIYREYPVDLSMIDFAEVTGDSLLFSIEVIVEGMNLNLYLPYSEFDEEDVSISFLPGYTFLEPFTEDQYTALAQPFDWQMLVTKPYGSELDGRIRIRNPDGIVIGTFNDHVFLPQGITSKYFDIHLAAGRSIGFDLKTVRASLEVGGQTVAETSADVRVVRCKIPETRDIAFVPDAEGKLEDFLRITGASFQPFTARSLVRAQLDAYDLLVIGSEAEEYYDVLRKVGDRLHEFVRNGGDILILGQSFGWPNGIFKTPIYTSKAITTAPAKIVNGGHRILSDPYTINGNHLVGRIDSASKAYPAIIGGGNEIITAGEPGSYLRVFTIGEGHVIYCGLPLLELAGKLDIEAIHLMANLINFGHGN